MWRLMLLAATPSTRSNIEMKRMLPEILLIKKSGQDLYMFVVHGKFYTTDILLALPRFLY